MLQPVGGYALAGERRVLSVEASGTEVKYQWRKDGVEIAGAQGRELVIEAMDKNDGLFKEEAADLLFHYLILLRSRAVSLSEIEEILKNRHSNS